MGSKTAEIASAAQLEHNRLFMLQCRSGKRTGPAAVSIAIAVVEVPEDHPIRRR